MPNEARQPPEDDLAVADRLHSAAIHLLRRLRAVDRAAGLSGPRLSALSVIVFRGPLTVTELATAEQVSLPTVSRMAKELEAQGLVRRQRDPGDLRVQLLRATARGRHLLRKGRERRVTLLAERLAELSPPERRLLGRAAPLLEHLARRPG